MNWNEHVIESAIKGLSGIDLESVRSAISTALEKELKMTRELTPSAIQVYKAIFNSESKLLKGDELVYLTGLNKKTVMLSVKELKKNGYLHYDGGSGKINNYHLLH